MNNNIIEFPKKSEPKNIESAILDFTYKSLEELESEVYSIFPEEEDPEYLFHLNLLGALPFRMICNGFRKEELLMFFNKKIDDANIHLKEIEEKGEISE